MMSVFSEKNGRLEMDSIVEPSYILLLNELLSYKLI